MTENRPSRITPPQSDSLERLRRRLVGFRRDDSGQSIVYLVLMMFLLACFTFMVINSGALIHDKMQVQSASDSAVLSGTTWIARGMNLNSMMNIFMALSMAELIYMKAVYATAAAALISPTIHAFWAQACLTTLKCVPEPVLLAEYGTLLGTLLEADQSADFMKDIMETLSQVEQGVHFEMPVVAEAESVRMAMLNGAGFGIMYPPAIPEEEGAMSDLCGTVLDGAAGGYEESEYLGAGGFTAALGAISGFNYSAEQFAFASALTAQFFGKEGPLWGEMQLPYQMHWSSTAPHHFTNVMFVMAVQSQYSVMCGGTWPPPVIPYTIPVGPWCFLCTPPTMNITNPANGLGAAWSFLGAGNPNVAPMMLSSDFASQSNFYGFAYKTPADVQAKFIPAVFQNTYGDSVGMLTIAQAQIYNPHIEGGMFSPHWRTHLTPVVLEGSTAEGAATYLLSSSFASMGADPTAISGLLAVVQSITGGGIEDLLAH
jgi:hypothetical protein